MTIHTHTHTHTHKHTDLTLRITSCRMEQQSTVKWLLAGLGVWNYIVMTHVIQSWSEAKCDVQCMHVARECTYMCVCVVWVIWDKNTCMDG